MKPTIENLKDSFRYSNDAFDDSRRMAESTKELFHGYHYTQRQLDELRRRGQPAEQFNVVRAYLLLLQGYLSGLFVGIKADGRHPADVASANVLTDVMQYTLEQGRFKVVSNEMKLDGLLSGLMVSYISSKKRAPTAYNINDYNLVVDHVSSNEILLDPDSKRPDFSDARYTHRFKWMNRDELNYLFGKSKTAEIIARNGEYGLSDVFGGEKEYQTDDTVAVFAKEDKYIVIHSIVKDDANLWEVYWSGDYMIQKTNLAKMGLTSPYNIVRVSNSEKSRYYGIFEGLTETQIAINQAILQIQLLVNGSKVYVQNGSVENLQEFRDAYNRVNSVIPVLNLRGIKDVDRRVDIQQQYMIINSALDRIKQQTGINEAFLGVAFSADSGKKVAIQRKATMMSLKYITDKVELHAQLLGETLANFIKIFYTKPMILSLTDDHNKTRWLSVNDPITDEAGTPALAYSEDDSGEPKVNSQGQFESELVYKPETEFKYTDVNIRIKVTSYDAEDEANQLMVDSFLNGSVGQLLAQMSPAHFLKLAALSALNTKTKYSADIAEVLKEVQDSMQQPQQAMGGMGGGASVQQRGSMGSGQPKGEI